MGDDIKVFTFKLTADEMKREAVLCKATSARGTQPANVKNENIEKRMTIKPGDQNWLRWERKYLIS